jgi:Domain of unknown function (DUF4281)
MRIEIFFALSVFLVAPLWLLMIGLPGLALTRRILSSPLVLLPLPVLYATLLVVDWPLLLYLIEHPTLVGLAVALGSPSGALIAWVHLLAIDLFVGRWIYLDSRDREIPSLAVVPILWLALLLGPVGLMLYLIVRSFGKPPPSAVERDRAMPSIVPSAAPPSLAGRKPVTPGSGPKTL